jgi:hypothetical protein
MASSAKTAFLSGIFRKLSIASATSSYCAAVARRTFVSVKFGREGVGQYLISVLDAEKTEAGIVARHAGLLKSLVHHIGKSVAN